MVEGLSDALPAPSPEALAHSERLRSFIAQRCLDHGAPISFGDYMSQVLYSPGMGYYMSGTAKFGADGDFITAPELTPLFGATLGREARSIAARCQGGVLELGAGSGKLAAGLLQNDSEGLLEYTILEPSADLVQRQKSYLQQSVSEDQFSRIRWVDKLPEHFDGVIIANEVMDALPVERFRTGQALMQQHVSSKLNSKWLAPSEALRVAVEKIQADLPAPLPDNYCSEVCLLLEPWISSLADCLRSGVLLLIDYGYPRREYYSEERANGSVACYYRHRSHDDPFIWPGLQDITAHVDFTAVAESGCSAGLDLIGYASQSSFLLDNQLLSLLEQQTLALTSDIERMDLARKVKTLTLPGEMGERFQVMAFGKGYDHFLQGFQSQDLSHRL